MDQAVLVDVLQAHGGLRDQLAGVGNGQRPAPPDQPGQVEAVGELDDTRTAMSRGSMVQPAIKSDVRITPDRAPGIDRAKIVVSRSAPQLLDLHIDLSYTSELQFRMFIDKEEQGRALVLNNLLKDSNGELRMTLNSTGLAAGIYKARIEALPFRGSPTPSGWLILEVR